MRLIAIRIAVHVVVSVQMSQVGMNSQAVIIQNCEPDTFASMPIAVIDAMRIAVEAELKLEHICDRVHAKHATAGAKPTVVKVVRERKLVCERFSHAHVVAIGPDLLQSDQVIFALLERFSNELNSRLEILAHIVYAPDVQ